MGNDQRAHARAAADVDRAFERLETLLQMGFDHLRKTIAVRPEKHRVRLSGGVRRMGEQQVPKARPAHVTAPQRVVFFDHIRLLQLIAKRGGQQVIVKRHRPAEHIAHVHRQRCPQAPVHPLVGQRGGGDEPVATFFQAPAQVQ